MLVGLGWWLTGCLALPILAPPGNLTPHRLLLMLYIMSLSLLVLPSCLWVTGYLVLEGLVNLDI